MVYRTQKDWLIRSKEVKANQKPEGWTKCGTPLYASHQVKDSEKKTNILKRVVHRIVR